MVKITYNGNKFTRRRLPTGRWITFRPNQTVEVESNRLTEELKGNREFMVDKDSPSKIGGGIKTHIKPSKRRGRPPKSKAEPKKEVKPPRSVIDKVKKPKGLKKKKGKKGIGIDLDGDGKVDVVVGDD